MQPLYISSLFMMASAASFGEIVAALTVQIHSVKAVHGHIGVCISYVFHYQKIIHALPSDVGAKPDFLSRFSLYRAGNALPMKKQGQKS